MVSELSMNQASAIKLQQAVKEKEQQLEQAYIRMERGEAPTDDAEREWFRMIRDEQRREIERQANQQVCVQLSKKYTITRNRCTFYRCNNRFPLVDLALSSPSCLLAHLF